MSGVQNFRVFVTNLPWTVGTNALKKYFSEFGRVSNVQVAFDKKTGLSRGFGFVSFRNEMDYITAVSQKEHVLDNKKILVRKKDEAGY